MDSKTLKSALTNTYKLAFLFATNIHSGHWLNYVQDCYHKARESCMDLVAVDYFLVIDPESGQQPSLLCLGPTLTLC